MSVVAYVWLMPVANKNVKIQLTPTATLPKVDQVPAKISTASTGTPTVKGTPTNVPGGKPTPVPPYNGPCDAISPYGFTTPNTYNLADIYKQINVCWVRLQVREFNLQKADGSYDFSTLDQIVAYLNAYKINIDMPLACFNGPTGTAKPDCFNSPYIPTPDEMAKFASAIATRYNCQAGSMGCIRAFEILNEEPDKHLTDYSLDDYGKLLQAGSQAIKVANPGAKVGMYGTFPSNPQRVTDVLNALFKGGYGKYMDFMNFHYYNGGFDPTTDYDSTHPSFDHKWQLVHSIAAGYGFPRLPIWVTEIGWTLKSVGGINPVTEEQQADYFEYVTLHAASSGGAVQKMFWYTVNYADGTNNIYPGGQPLPAFDRLKDVVKQHPRW